MARMKITEFQVVGRGIFPADMLRYDACYPADSSDGLSISQSAAHFMEQPTERRITLKHRDVYAGWEPTADRWRSFGWVVDQNSVRRWDS